ncbi:MAG: 50S ribosomal protein L32 [Klebsiella michiganensis]|nr:50S ribosomal protein L32 [Klebsiella michiganensis]
MAVQQNKPTRSKRGMRRSHDALTAVTMQEDASERSTRSIAHYVTGVNERSQRTCRVKDEE